MNTLMTAGEQRDAVETRVPAAGFTAIMHVPAGPEAVFAELADIERLPQWAGTFCERVFLSRGRWAGLTSLGELWLELDADARAGSVVLRAGWQEGELYAVTLRLVADVEGGTRVTLEMRGVDDDDHRRIGRAVREALLSLAVRMGGGLAGRPGR